MSNATDMKVLGTLYDRLFSAITYSPGGSTAAFDKSSTLIQFATNQALNPADFANAFSPANPNGDMRAAEIFSNMVDQIPASQLMYVMSGKKVSDVYALIARGNSSVQIDPEQEAVYDKAYEYLNVTKTMKDFMGDTTTQVLPSPIYSAYQTNINSYLAALSSYRLTWSNYDLSDSRQQREWQAKEPMLNAAITKAWNDLQQQGAPMVERALQALVTTINSGIRQALSDAQGTMARAGLASNLAGQPKWYLSYATPVNWIDDSAAANMTDLTLTSSSLTESSDAHFSSLTAGCSAGWGLWRVGASASHSQASQSSHMEATSFTLNGKIGVVNIYRPWFNPVILGMNNWFDDAFDQNGISDGHLHGAMPMYPVGMIVARDIHLSGNWSTEDKSHFEQATSGSTSVGWGPFQIGGSYSNSSSSDRLHSTFDGTTLKVPGCQVIGWINAIAPPCPPMKAQAA